VIAQVVRIDGQVLSVGGGAVLDPGNVARLRAGGTIVWLAAPAEVLWTRISQDARSVEMRPNLTADGGLDEVRKLLAAREPAYRAAADFTIGTGSSSPEDVAAAILEALPSVEGG
jgi:shikimate kinase